MSVGTYSLAREGDKRLSPHFRVREFACRDGADLVKIDTDLVELLERAKRDNVVSRETLQKVGLLDDYVIEHFRLAFGNRIVKQLKEFVPAYVGCGGTELDGLDYVLAKKVLRKFESMNLSFIRDEIDGLIDYLHDLFGEDSMGECVAYLQRLKKLV